MNDDGTFGDTVAMLPAGETITMAIGQSYLLVTPLQMAQMMSALFNGGYIYQPKIIQWVGSDRKELYRITPTVKDKINADPKHFELLRRALTGVVNDPHGTAYLARINGIKMAGKTGTAQVVNLDLGKAYEREEDIPFQLRDHAWFVAIADADRPAITVSILIEHGGHGGSVAAPIAKALIEEYYRKQGKVLVQK